MKQRLGLVALVALIILNIFLIPRALERGRGQDIPAADRQARSQPTRVASESRTTEPRDEPSEEPDENAQSDDTVLDEGTTLMATSGDLVVQAERGSCASETSARIVLSTDGAKTFDPVQLDDPLAAVLALHVTDDGIQVIGADADCEPITLTSADGEQWDAGEAPSDWHLTADPEARQVVSPDGDLDTPCTPTALSVESDAVVRLLCTNGRLLGLSGSSWAALGNLPGATAIRYPTPAVGFAIAPDGDCENAVLRTDDGGADWRQLACLEGVDAEGAVAGRDGRYIARAGDVTLVTDDGGDTWTRP